MIHFTFLAVGTPQRHSHWRFTGMTTTMITTTLRRLNKCLMISWCVPHWQALEQQLLRACLDVSWSGVAWRILVMRRRMPLFWGVALALLFGTSITLGVGVVALTMAILIHGLSGQGASVDTMLGVLARGALALGLVAVTLIPRQRIDLDAYLFWGGGTLVAAAVFAVSTISSSLRKLGT